MGKTKIVSTTHFYERIAAEYNSFLSNPKDHEVRMDVRSFFLKTVSGKVMMDFGGGTGLDLPWLIGDGYKVYFCEPSHNMRKKAEEVAMNFDEGSRPVFLDNSDFKLWGKESTPFHQKLDGILANFGVLNYVDDLPSLFEKFNDVLEENGSIVVNLLYPGPASLLSRYLPNAVRAVLRGERVKVGSEYDGIRHETTLYSLRDIRMAAKKYFVVKSSRKLGTRSDFLLIHLVKNEKAHR